MKPIFKIFSMNKKTKCKLKSLGQRIRRSSNNFAEKETYKICEKFFLNDRKSLQERSKIFAKKFIFLFKLWSYSCEAKFGSVNQ